MTLSAGAIEAQPTTSEGIRDKMSGVFGRVAREVLDRHLPDTTVLEATKKTIEGWDHALAESGREFSPIWKKYAEVTAAATDHLADLIDPALGPLSGRHLISRVFAEISLRPEPLPWIDKTMLGILKRVPMPGVTQKIST